jgi:hypothetical protein
MVADHQGRGYQGELKQERGQLRVNLRRRASWFAATGAPRKPVAVVGMASGSGQHEKSRALFHPLLEVM